MHWVCIQLCVRGTVIAMIFSDGQCRQHEFADIQEILEAGLFLFLAVYKYKTQADGKQLDTLSLSSHHIDLIICSFFVVYFFQ